jgi:hypothetical protein
MLGDRSRDQSKGATLSLADIPHQILEPFENTVQSVEQLEKAVAKYLKASKQRQQGPGPIRRLAEVAVLFQRNAPAG